MRSPLTAFFLWAAILSNLSAAEIITVAGNGSNSSSGDGGPALAAGVVEPFGTAVDRNGALLICETKGHRIRRVDPATGTITTIAGTGEAGHTGDGGPATAAQINEPYEIVFDPRGRITFVDMRAHAIRRIETNGTITTLAGTGEAGFSGDGGPATAALLKQPHSLAYDSSGRLYIADIGNHRVRRVDPDTGLIDTFAGTGGRGPTPDGGRFATVPLNGPRALAFDHQGHLLLALREGNALYRLDLASGTIHHRAGTGKSGYSGDGGDARQAQLAGPKGVAVAADGTILLADTESHTIRAIHPATNVIRTLVGDGKKGNGPDGPPRSCRLARPHGVTITPSGELFIGDSENHRVRRVMFLSE